MRVGVVVSYRRYRSSYWLYNNSQRFEDHLECTQCEHRVPCLMTFLKQTEQGYLDGPGFGCTSPARANSRSSGSQSGPVVSGSVE